MERQTALMRANGITTWAEAARTSAWWCLFYTSRARYWYRVWKAGRDTFSRHMLHLSLRDARDRKLWARQHGWKNPITVATVPDGAKALRVVG